MYGFIRKALAGAIAYLAIMAMVGTCLLMSNSISGIETWPNRIAAIGMSLLLIWGAWIYRYKTIRYLAAASEYLNQFSTGRWTLWMLVTGVFLRIAWVSLFHAIPASDGTTYLELAKQLSTGDGYHMGGTFAYWPPGYPLFLTVWVWLFDESRIAWILPNILLFCTTGLGVWKLGSKYLNPGATNLAVSFVAIWPGYVTLVATPEKENLLIGLIPWLIIAWLSSLRSYRIFAVIAGVMLGFMDLTQPACLLLPVVLFISGTLLQVRLYRVIQLTVLLLIGVVVVIGPWTVRNYQVLGVPILVSTNGGSGLYRANNTLATGGYTQRGEVDLSGLDEVSADREGRRLAIKWIIEHPSAFLSLAIGKQLLFLGDDAGGIYTTLRRGLVTDPMLYAIVKTLANIMWVTFWLAILSCITVCWRCSTVCDTLFITIAMVTLYFFALHSVFESNGKYHQILWPLFPFLLLSIVPSSMVNQMEPDSGP